MVRDCAPADAVRTPVGEKIARLLVPGARAPRTLATVRVSLEGCGWGSDVRWHGSWVRYRNADGKRLALDASA